MITWLFFVSLIGEIPQWTNLIAYLVFLVMAVIVYSTVVSAMPKPTANFKDIGGYTNRNSFPQSQTFPLTSPGQHRGGVTQRGVTSAAL